VPYAELKEFLRQSRVYFYTGTYPASYTLNYIEARMTGIPVVAIGPRLGNSPYEAGQNTYEIEDLIDNGLDGFYSDDPVELREKVEWMLKDLESAKRIGQLGRDMARQVFGKEVIKKQWQEFFDGL